MDAIALLKKDHRTVEELFSRFEKAGDGALKLKRKLVDQIIVELSKHAAIEEAYFYPAARKAFGKEDSDIVLESLEEHHVVKWLLNELIGMKPDAERFDAKVTVLMENVRHHVKEEETTFFTDLRKVMKPAELKVLGERLEKAKRLAPTRPHPMGPDTPPGNRLAAPVEMAFDRGRDLLKTLASRPRGKRPAQATPRQIH